MKIRLLPLLGLVGSCALFTSSPPDYSPDYVTGGARSRGLSASELQEKLTRRTSMGGGTYFISLLPMTRPLVEAQVRELSHQRGLSPEESDRLLSSRLASEVEERTCFRFEYKALRFAQVAGLGQWSLRALTDLPEVGEGEEAQQEELAQSHPLRFDRPDRLAVQSEEMKVHDKIPSWSNWALACTDRPLRLEQGSAVKIKVGYVNWPFPDEVRVDWAFGRPLPTTDGDGTQEKPEELVPPKGNYQRYRGY